jgi:hypothetical protein
MSVELKENTILMATKTIEDKHVTQGHSYRVLDYSPEEEKEVLIRCADWKARKIKKSLFKVPTPKPMK